MPLRRSFDHLAAPYAALEHAVFGGALERTRFAHLERLSGARRILVLGEGDGRCLSRLLEHAPHARIDVVDKSRKMLALARERVSADARVVFHETDARQFEPATSPDAIVTHFFLDCFEAEALAELVPRLSEMLEPKGLWLYADFRPDARSVTQRALVWSLYRAFRLVTDIESRTLIDPRGWLARCGLECLERTHFGRGGLTSELWQKA